MSPMSMYGVTAEARAGRGTPFGGTGGGFGPPGSYKPGAATTGAPTLTPSTTITGAQSVFTDGETILNTRFEGVITSHMGGLGTGGVTYFKNCVFAGPVAAPGTHTGLVRTFASDSGRVEFEDCTFVPQTPGEYWMAIQGAYVVLKRCDIYNVVDGIEFWDSKWGNAYFDAMSLIEACWIHDLSYFSPSADGDDKTHNDCIQFEGGGNIEVVGNFLDCHLSTAVGNNPGFVPRPAQNTGNAACMIKPDVNLIDDLNIHHNWLYGGGYTVNMAHDDNTPNTRYLTNVGNVSDNLFDRTAHAFKQISMPGTNNPPATSGTFLNNRFEDDMSLVTVYQNG